ncbi:uncharacterized protein LOC110982047 isoform X2 [Acanthaster planci]|uniref:Uncharacterized protein LOC110982047 isoform X2 n=1 Tax=Acanthaster planci TaxID=133434 RepID=A0A8B7YT49_ACAPL|nr:uncharacterized protein LOC110982047 isoform X2 [Acanthaster planci]
MKLEDFHKHSTAKLEGECLSSDLERQLCKMFRVVEIVGKRGRTVPVLPSNEAVAWFNALVAKRHEAGVAQDNNFLFTRFCYGGRGHIRGSDCLRAHADKASLDNASSIRSIKFRKHVATASQIPALKEHQLETLANFMGHDLRVHREYYQLPDTVQRVTKLSKPFLSLERGNLPSQQGKSLDDLHVTGGFTSEEDSSDSGDCSDSSEDSCDESVENASWCCCCITKKGTLSAIETNEAPSLDTAEKIDVQEGLRKFFQLRKVLGKLDIEAACTVALQTRVWKSIKDFCRNTMRW